MFSWIKVLFQYFMYEEIKEGSMNTMSRKYKITLLIFFTATIMCLIPPLVSAFIFKITPVVILSGSEWISAVTLISGFYFGANVVQKKITTNDNTSTPKNNIPNAPEQTNK